MMNIWKAIVCTTLLVLPVAHSQAARLCDATGEPTDKGCVPNNTFATQKAFRDGTFRIGVDHTRQPWHWGHPHNCYQVSTTNSPGDDASLSSQRPPSKAENGDNGGGSFLYIW